MTKMEALREVNETLTEILHRIETHMFIENINTVDDRISDKSQNMVLRKHKMVD